MLLLQRVSKLPNICHSVAQCAPPRETRCNPAQSARNRQRFHCVAKQHERHALGGLVSNSQISPLQSCFVMREFLADGDISHVDGPTNHSQDWLWSLRLNKRKLTGLGVTSLRRI